MENELSKARLIELATFKPSGANTVYSASREEWQGMARRLLAVEESKDVARAALDYIDALPKEVVASLPVMPGFDRDWAENTLTFFSNPCSEQESAFYQRYTAPVPNEVLEQVIPTDTRFMVDKSNVEQPESVPSNQGRSSAPDFIIYECDDCGALSVDEHESTCHCMGPKRTWTAIPVSKVSGGKDE